MAEYIDRQAALDELRRFGSVWMEYTDDMSAEKIAKMALKGAKDSLIDILSSLPSADVQPVRHGHWIERESGTEDKENGFETVIVCSHCDFPATTFYSEDCESRTQIRTDFCPNCGARMDGE